MNRIGDHLDEMTCLLYLDGQLEAGAARQLVAHTEACPECLRLLGSLERETHLLHDSLVEDDEAVPAHLLEAPPIENISWGRIGALGLAAAGLYGVWSAVAQPWLDQLQQVGLGQNNLLTTFLFSGVFWKGWKDMLNIFELLSMASVATLVFLLVARNLHRLTSLPVVLTAVLVAGLGLPAPASATEFYRSATETYTLASGAVVHSDLVVAAPVARIDGTVEGDLVASGRTVTISGHITGDVIAWAQDIRINGTVDGSCLCGAQTLQINGQVHGSARVFAQVVLVEGSVDKNLMAWVQTLEIASKGKVGGSVMGFTVSIISDGRIERDLTAEFAKNDLNGYIGGNATLKKGYLTIGPQAEIHGSASYTGEHRPDVSSQAKLTSPLSVEMQSRWDKYMHPRYYWSHLLRVVAALLLGLVFLFIAPDFSLRTLQKGDRILVSLGFGAVALVATPILAVISCITLVGIPVGIASLLLYVVALYSTQIVVGTWLGTKLIGQRAGQGARIGRMAVGLLIVRVVTLVPYLGVVAGFFVVLAGLGAIVQATQERFDRAGDRAAAGSPA
jgi:cytoskeletal protein CcmA (bactofilin family)